MATGEKSCGCCEGIRAATPRATANRPGLSALAYRAGTHATFLETMKARLSSHWLAPDPGPTDESGQPEKNRIRPLQDLKRRDAGDPAIALLDAWATVADVLTFYQERIANEGFLRTATERRSVLELARLIGYGLRPGVASSAWLALEMENGHDLKLQPYELKAQSLPGAGELPQVFENIEPIDARHCWNNLQPRLKQPQTVESITSGRDLSPERPRIYVKGISTNLKPNDVVLITESNQAPAHYRVADVRPDPPNDRTLVTFRIPSEAPVPAMVKADAMTITAMAEHFASAEVTRKYRIAANTEMAGRVKGYLGELIRTMRLKGLSAEDGDRAVRLALDRIEGERAMAEGEQYRRLERWLTAMMEDLTKASQGLMVAAGREKAAAFAMAAAPAVGVGGLEILDPLKKAVAGLTREASLPPRSAASLNRDPAKVFQARGDAGLQMVGTFQPGLQQGLQTALANAKVAPGNPIRAYAFRAAARPFGHNAPLRAVIKNDGKYTSFYEWDIDDPFGEDDPEPYGKEEEGTVALVSKTPAAAGAAHTNTALYLDGEYKISSCGWLIIEPPGAEDDQALYVNLGNGDATATQQSLAAYGVSGKSTRIELATANWYSGAATFDVVRSTVVHVESEELQLAEEPIEASICGGADDWIELDGLYSGLQSGRWLMVSGERDDILDETGGKVRGVHAAELVMLAEVVQDVRKLPTQYGHSYGYGYGGSSVLPGDQTHTSIRLAKKLSYCYRRDTVTIYGNVVKATHGETRRETLGSGDAGQAFQTFALKQPPLTYVASPTPAGAESTLQVYVNDVQWHEADSLAGQAPNARVFTTQTDHDGKTTVIFGNGHSGLRPPTGVENISAAYRNGIGRAGNVRAGQISQLMSRPLGLKGVINPLRASGGADREGRDTARKNAPRTVTALDRLVSLTDYADFACTFAGIGKAVTAKISDGRRQWVHVTVAGADDIPIDAASDLYRNLLRALREYGDPCQPVMLQIRELMLLLVKANVRIEADYQWEKVATAVRHGLLGALGFRRRELGQDVVLGEVMAAIQSVPGVAYVDVDVLGGVPEKASDVIEGRAVRRLLTPYEISRAATEQIMDSDQPKPRLAVKLADFEHGAMRPAQLACLSPEVADTLVINQIEP